MLAMIEIVYNSAITYGSRRSDPSAVDPRVASKQLLPSHFNRLLEKPHIFNNLAPPTSHIQNTLPTQLTAYIYQRQNFNNLVEIYENTRLKDVARFKLDQCFKSLLNFQIKIFLTFKVLQIFQIS